MSGIEYEEHPLSEIFPRGVYVDELAEDIRTRGLIEPVTLYDGQVLDGRLRVRACSKAEVELRTEELIGDAEAALQFVLSKNLHRRHLQESQRAMVAAKIANISHGGDRRSEQSSNLSLEKMDQRRAAKIMGVSRSSVQSAAKVIKLGTAPLIVGVEQGWLRVGQAAKACDFGKERLEAAWATGSYFGLRDLLAATVAPEVGPKRILKIRVPAEFAEEYEDTRGLLLMCPDQFITACFTAFKEKNADRIAKARAKELAWEARQR